MDHSDRISEILSLPAEERLRIVEVIWDSIASESTSIPVSDKQRREIEARIAEHERDPSRAIPWEVARRQLRDGR